MIKHFLAHKPKSSPALAAAMKGDPAATNIIIQECDKAIRHGVMKVLGPKRPKQDHEDVQQEARLALCLALKTMNSQNVKGFAYQLAHNKACRFLTRKDLSQPGRQDMLDGTHPLKQIPVKASSPEHHLANQRTLENILTVLPSNITPRQHQVLELHILQDKSISDVAKTLGIQPANVRVITSLLRNRARNLNTQLNHINRVKSSESLKFMY